MELEKVPVLTMFQVRNTWTLNFIIADAVLPSYRKVLYTQGCALPHPEAVLSPSTHNVTKSLLGT